MWRWIWLVSAVLFGVGEMATPGSFFLLPFAIGAAAASILAFAGVDIGWEWAGFIAISVVTLLAMRPLARRLDRQGSVDGVGSRRLIGKSALVLDAIGGGPHAVGLVRVDREEWRAESADGSPLQEGDVVRVADVEGTRLLVKKEDRA